MTPSEAVRQAVAQWADRPVEQVREDYHLVNDLGFDSLGIWELCLAIEAELGIELDDRDMHSETTVGQLITVATSKVRKAA